MNAGQGFTTTTATVTFSGAFVSPGGDVPAGCAEPLQERQRIGIRSQAIRSASDNRTIVGSEYVIPPDNSRPSLVISALQGADTVWVQSTEPLMTASIEVLFERGSSTEAPVQADVGEGATRFTVAVPDDLDGVLRARDKMSITSRAATDLAANESRAASRTVAFDDTPPEVDRITVTEPLGTRQVSVALPGADAAGRPDDALVISTNLGTSVDGAAGNQWRIDVNVRATRPWYWSSAQLSAVRVSESSRRIQLQVLAEAVVDDLVSELNHNRAFNSRFTASTVGGQWSSRPLDTRGLVSFTQGISTVEVAVLWAEPVHGCTRSHRAVDPGNIEIDVDGDGEADFALDGRTFGDSDVVRVASDGSAPLLDGDPICDTRVDVRSGTLMVRIESASIDNLPGTDSLATIQPGAASDFARNASADVIQPNRRGHRRWPLAILCALLLASIAAPVPAGAAATDASFTRLAGLNRYETSVAIAQKYIDERSDAGAGTDTAIITSGADEHFGYVLTAPPLSRQHGAPLVLSEPDELPEAVATFVSSNNLEHAIILGGTGVISDDVAVELRDLGLSVSRVARDDEYRTAIAMAARVGSPAGVPGNYRRLGPTALVATGEVFADALAAGPLAYQGRHPVLLTPSLDLHPEVKQFLMDSGTKHVVILGGPRAVGPWVEYDIGDLGITVSRLYGPDRYATATRVAEEMLGPDSPQRCFKGDEFGLAFGQRAADALVSSPLLGERCAALLLTERNSLPRAVAGLLDSDEFAPGDDDGRLALTVFGGPNAVTSFAVLQAVAAGTLPQISVDIAGLEGRCALEVSFDEPVKTSDAENLTNYRRGGVAFGSGDAEVDAGSGSSTSAATILLTGSRRYPESVVPVGCERPLVANEEIEIRGDLIGEPDGRRVVRRVVANVAADWTPPTISLVANDAAPTALAAASEPIRLRTGIAEVTRQGADPETATVIVRATEGATTIAVPAPAEWEGPLRAGDRIVLHAEALEDLAGNPSNRTIATAAGDNTPPEVAKVTASMPRSLALASISVDVTHAGKVISEALVVTARSFGEASGASGNLWTLEIELEPDWLPTRLAVPTVERTGSGGRLHVLAAPQRTVDEIVADLNRDSSFRSWFIAELADGVSSTEDMPVTLGGSFGPTRLSGGLSSVDLTVVWSEPLLDCEAGDGLVVPDRLEIDADRDGSPDYALDGRGAAAAGVAFVAAPGGNPAIIAGRANCDTAAGVQDGTLAARIQSADLTKLPGLNSELHAGDGAAIDLNGNWSEPHRFSSFTRG